MKTEFKYKFTKVFYALFIIGILLATWCIYANIKRFILLLNANDGTATNYVASVMCVLIGVLAYVFIIPSMFSSKYQIKDNQLITRWGLIVNKIPTKNITTVTKFRLTEKLVIYYNDDTYSNICIEKEEYEAFVDALKQSNKKIFYSLNT